MTTQLLISRQCSRCPRVDQREITQEEIVNRAKSGQPLEDTVPALVIVVRGKTIATFAHLCTACQQIVADYVGNAARPVEKSSSKRVKKTKLEEPASPQAPSSPGPGQAEAQEAKTAAKAPSGPGTPPTRPGAR